MVELRPYSQNWPALFELERTAIEHALAIEDAGVRALAIEHIGSTSVPGLAAKPIIDIAIAVENFEAASVLVEPLVAIDYEYLGEYGIPRRHYFRRGDPRTHHIHMFEFAGDKWRNHIAFRDYLRSNADVAAEYERLKTELARVHKHDIRTYTDAKADFIQATIRRALEL